MHCIDLDLTLLTYITYFITEGQEWSMVIICLYCSAWLQTIKALFLSRYLILIFVFELTHLLTNDK